MQKGFRVLSFTINVFLEMTCKEGTYDKDNITKYIAS
jgi:hypothetical protein